MLESNAYKTLRTVDPADRVTGVFIGRPVTRQLTEYLEGAALVGDHRLDCKADSPWLAVSLAVTDETGRIRVERQTVQKTALITPTELRSSAFAEFQKKLSRCLSARVIEYRPLGAPYAH